MLTPGDKDPFKDSGFQCCYTSLPATEYRQLAIQRRTYPLQSAQPCGGQKETQRRSGTSRSALAGIRFFGNFRSCCWPVLSCSEPVLNLLGLSSSGLGPMCITQRPLMQLSTLPLLLLFFCCRSCCFYCRCCCFCCCCLCCCFSCCCCPVYCRLYNGGQCWLLLSRNLPPSTRRASRTRKKWRSSGRFSTSPRARPTGIRKERRMATAIIPHLAFFQFNLNFPILQKQSIYCLVKPSKGPLQCLPKDSPPVGPSVSSQPVSDCSC